MTTTFDPVAGRDATDVIDVPAVEIRDLRVDYGDLVAVDDIRLTVPRGEVYGLVGPNGAGKTSTLRVLATLMEPTYGEVELCGIDVLEDPGSARRILGYMPDLAPAPKDLKVWEFLDFHADTHVLGNGAGRRKRLDECLEIVNLSHKRVAWCKALSRGETQRLVLAKTLLHRPRVLILDEPASGLDALSRRELRLVLQTLAREGATVFVSSHILLELAEMCSSLCVMHHGRLLASGSVEDIRRELGRSERRLTVKVLNRPEEAAAWLESRPGVHDLSVLDSLIALGFKGDDDEQAALLAGVLGRGIAVKSFDEKVQSFEDILVDVARNRMPERPLSK